MAPADGRTIPTSTIPRTVEPCREWCGPLNHADNLVIVQAIVVSLYVQAQKMIQI